MPGVSGSIVHDGCKGVDHTQPATALLNEFKATHKDFEWIHSYYWPGDDYYAFVKVPSTKEGDDAIQAFSALGGVELVSKYRPSDLTHRKITIEEEFE